ncbi:MAG TPA: hypothetical protein VIJ35_01580, partial [Bradyrhizobium sp.]
MTALTEENRLDRSIQAKGGISVPMIGARAAIPTSTDCVSDIFRSGEVHHPCFGEGLMVAATP